MPEKVLKAVFFCGRLIITTIIKDNICFEIENYVMRIAIWFYTVTFKELCKKPKNILVDE